MRALVKFAGCEVDTRGVTVNVKGCRNGWRGMAYHGVPGESNAPKSTRYLVTLGIAPPGVLRLPSTGQHKKRADPYCLMTWQECLVYIAAHEFKHIEQFKERLSASEVRCEKFAAFTVKQLRLKGGIV